MEQFMKIDLQIKKKKDLKLNGIDHTVDFEQLKDSWIVNHFAFPNYPQIHEGYPSGFMIPLITNPKLIIIRFGMVFQFVLKGDYPMVDGILYIERGLFTSLKMTDFYQKENLIWSNSWVMKRHMEHQKKVFEHLTNGVTK